MMKPERECQFKGHQGIEGTGCQYICTFNDCKLKNRWVCSECLLEQLHHHGRQKQNHIMKQQQFLEYLIGLQEKCKNDNEYYSLQELLKETEQLIQFSEMLKNQIISQINNCNQQNDLENIIILAKEDFYQLENYQIQQIIKMNFKNYDQKQQYELMKQITQQTLNISKIIMNEQRINKVQEKEIQDQMEILQMLQQHNEEYISDFDEDCVEKQKNVRQTDKLCKEDVTQEVNLQQQQKQTKSEIIINQQAFKQTETQKIIHKQNIQDNKYQYAEFFKYNQKIPIQISQISQNDKYLVIGRFDKKFLVFDVTTQTLTVEFYSYNNNFVISCKFTLDQKYLLCCDDKGYISQYDISQNFKFLHANKIHKDMINDIVFMDNYIIITCSADKSIQLRSIKSQQQIRIIDNAHNDIIYSIDYYQKNDIIFSCSKDKSIKLFKQSSGKLLFKQDKIHNRDLFQIKLISNNRLLSSSIQELILWDVNYDKKTLKNIKIFNELNYNFTSVLDGTNIVLICQNTVQILDNDLNLITSIKHNVKELSMYYRIVQQNQMNYLLIIGDQHIQILKRV